MGEDIEQRLAEATARLREHQLVASQAEGLSHRQAEIAAEIDELRAAHAIEERDVERLENVSLTRIIASLLGSRDERLGQERAEAEAARYRVAEAAARLEAVRREHAAALARLDGLAGAPEAYEAVLEDKEQFLADSPGPQGARLVALAEERGRVTGERHELTEAMDAAHDARGALQLLAQTLGSAAGWSTYDTFFGGGMVGSMVKHSKLDKAAKEAALANQMLAVLRTELADVAGAGSRDLSLRVDGLTQFVDIFLDNIFTDLMVGSRIERARAAVGNCQRDVDAVGRSLHQRIETADRRLADIESERRRLLTAQ
jgi:hypothetical protein